MTEAEIQQVFEKIGKLSAQRQEEVADFIEFLTAKESTGIQPRAKTIQGSIADIPFVGRWKDREDMSDGLEWVRSLRRREWGG